MQRKPSTWMPLKLYLDIDYFNCEKPKTKSKSGKKLEGKLH